MPLKRVLTVFFLSLLAVSITACGSSSHDYNLGQSYQNYDAPVRLAFLSVPQRAAGAPLNTFRVAVLDHNGLVVPYATHPITVALIDPAGATLSGTTTVNAVDGVATFDDISVDLPGDYNFIATAPDLESAESQYFTITPNVPMEVVFLSQPPSPPNVVMQGDTLPPIEVEVRDGFGNPISTSSTVTIVIGNDPSGKATLSGTTQIPAHNGRVTFDDLSVTSGGGVMVLAAVVGDGIGISDPFVVMAPFSIYASAVTPLSSLLVQIDPSDFSANPVGPFTEPVSGLVSMPDGRLLGAIQNASDLPVLVNIDPGDASYTEAANPIFNQAFVEVTDMTVDPATGTVYAYLSNTGSGDDGVYIINTSTGVGTLIGNGSGRTDGYVGLTWDPFKKVLFAAFGDDQSLATIDVESGLPTEVAGSAGQLPVETVSLFVNPFDTTLNAIQNEGPPANEERLWVVDPETGASTYVTDVEFVVSATIAID